MYTLYHKQELGEIVEDIFGDLNHLIGTPLLRAEETRLEVGDKTFYRLHTNKGSVVIRWSGTANGYYSESVDFAHGRPNHDEP